MDPPGLLQWITQLWPFLHLTSLAFAIVIAIIYAIAIGVAIVDVIDNVLVPTAFETVYLRQLVDGMLLLL